MATIIQNCRSCNSSDIEVVFKLGDQVLSGVFRTDNLDDILSGYLTDYRFAQLFSVLDYRYLMRKKTIITSNEDLRVYNLSNPDYKRLVDRLYEVGEFVYFDYPSRRSGKIQSKINAIKRV